jgi:hypothetical protein
MLDVAHLALPAVVQVAFGDQKGLTARDRFGGYEQC